MICPRGQCLGLCVALVSSLLRIVCLIRKYLGFGKLRTWTIFDGHHHDLLHLFIVYCFSHAQITSRLSSAHFLLASNRTIFSRIKCLQNRFGPPLHNCGVYALTMTAFLRLWLTKQPKQSSWSAGPSRSALGYGARGPRYYNDLDPMPGKVFLSSISGGVK